MAPGAGHRKVSLPPQGRGTIGGGHQQPHLPTDRQIVEVVANEGNGGSPAHRARQSA
jgi:hypothetical protein